MDTVADRFYAVELFADGRWQEFYRSEQGVDRADAQAVFERLLEADPGLRARLIAGEVLRSTVEATR